MGYRVRGACLSSVRYDTLGEMPDDRGQGNAMSTNAQSDQTQGPEPSTGRKDQRESWQSYIEKQIRAAQERGEFANLPGAGRPLELDVNPFAGDRALAYSLLKANGVAPREVALGREVDEDLARAEAIVGDLRRRRDQLARRLLPPFPSERRAYNVLRGKCEVRYEEALKTINSKILSLNIAAPTALHRQLLDVEARMRAFAEEFPPLAE